MQTTDYLFIATFPNCYSYCDTRVEEKGDYKVIACVFFRPLELKIYTKHKAKYSDIIRIATDQYNEIKNNPTKEIIVSGTGQTILPIIKI